MYVDELKTFFIDIEEDCNTPNAVLRMEMTLVQKRPSCVEHSKDQITGDVIEYALKKALSNITRKEP